MESPETMKIYYYYFSVFSRSILASSSIGESYDNLTEELYSVLNNTLRVVEFNKCLIADGSCKIPAECIESINGQSCKCDDFDDVAEMSSEVEAGFNCTCY